VKTKYMIALYVLAMVAANLIVWKLGKWASPFIAFVLIGFDLTMRDVLHERLTRLQMMAVICAGGLITYFVNPSAQMIAVASASAFALAALADWTVYAAMHKRPWLIRSNSSNVVGAAVDSLVFPTIAFGMLLPQIVLLQFAAKVSGGFIWSLILKRARFA